MMAINLGDPIGRVQACVAEGGLTFPIAMDADPRDASYAGYGVTKEYESSLTPTLCLLDSRGRIVWHAWEFRLRRLPELRAALARLGVR
jgi:hypothetical protein